MYDQGQEPKYDDNLVRQRIEDFPQIGLLVQTPREITVKTVSQRGRGDTRQNHGISQNAGFGEKVEDGDQQKESQQ